MLDAWVARALPMTSQAKLCAIASGFFVLGVFIFTDALATTTVAAVCAVVASIPLGRFLRPVRQRDGHLAVPKFVGAVRLASYEVAEVDVVPFRFGSFRGWVIEVRAQDGRRVKAWSTAEDDRTRAVGTQKQLLEGLQTA